MLLAGAQVGGGVLLTVCSTQGVDTLSNCTGWQLLLWTNHPLLREVIWPPYKHCSSPLALSSPWLFKIPDTDKALEKKYTALQQV